MMSRDLDITKKSCSATEANTLKSDNPVCEDQQNIDGFTCTDFGLNFWGVGLFKDEFLY